jgi:hypothetical protein
MAIAAATASETKTHPAARPTFTGADYIIAIP